MKPFLFINAIFISLLIGQENDSLQFVFEPPSLKINVGENQKVTIKLLDILIFNLNISTFFLYQNLNFFP